MTKHDPDQRLDEALESLRLAQAELVAEVERRETAEALVAETREQAETWVGEVQAILDAEKARADEATRLLEDSRGEGTGDQLPEPPVDVNAAPEQCAVCRRSAEGRSKAELEQEGWAVERGQGVCPSCREAGWQLPRGADSPFRRFVDRQAAQERADG